MLVFSPSCAAVLPFAYPEVIPGKHMSSTFDSEYFSSYLYIYSKDDNLYHNAGYDALVTGKIFLKTAHLYAFTKYLNYL